MVCSLLCVNLGVYGEIERDIKAERSERERVRGRRKGRKRDTKREKEINGEGET